MVTNSHVNFLFKAWCPNHPLELILQSAQASHHLSPAVVFSSVSCSTPLTWTLPQWGGWSRLRVRKAPGYRPMSASPWRPIGRLCADPGRSPRPAVACMYPWRQQRGRVDDCVRRCRIAPAQDTPVYESRKWSMWKRPTGNAACARTWLQNCNRHLHRTARGTWVESYRRSTVEWKHRCAGSSADVSRRQTGTNMPSRSTIQPWKMPSERNFRGRSC